jgi:Cu-Zn family superoxide dismutase
MVKLVVAVLAVALGVVACAPMAHAESLRNEGAIKDNRHLVNSVVNSEGRDLKKKKKGPRPAPYRPAEKAAVCVPLIGGNSGAIGTIEFSDAGAAGVRAKGTLTGLTPGQHGWHIHQLGNTSSGCASTGGHYNPKNFTHGAPSDVVRHAGDLGNLVADSNGVAIIDITDKHIAIASIVGRAVVVHVGVDDLGKGGHVDSLKTGNAGGRFACGVIGLAL